MSCLLVAAIVALGGRASADFPPPASGDWWVGNDTAVSNTAVLVNGSLHVVNGSRLVLTNVALSFDRPGSAPNVIEVEAGSSLFMEGSSVDRANSTYGLTASILGTLEVRNSTVANLSTGTGLGSTGFAVENDTGAAVFDRCYFTSGSYEAWVVVKQGGALEVANSSFYVGRFHVMLYTLDPARPSQFSLHDSHFANQSTLLVEAAGPASAPHRAWLTNLTHGTTTAATFITLSATAPLDAAVSGVDAQGVGVGWGLVLEVRAPMNATVSRSRFVGFFDGVRINRPDTNATVGSIRLDGLDLNGSTFGLRAEGNTSAHLGFPLEVSGCNIASDSTAVGIYNWRANLSNSTLTVRPGALALWIVEAIVSLDQVEHNTSAILHDARGYPQELFEAWWSAPLEIVWREGGAPAAGWNASLVLRVGGAYLNGTVDAGGHLPGAPARLLVYRLVENSTFDLDARVLNGTLSRPDRPSIAFSQPITGNLSTVRIVVHDSLAPNITLLDPAWPRAFNTLSFSARTSVFDPETGIVNGNVSFNDRTAYNWSGAATPYLEVETNATVLADGSYALVVRAWDGAGNAAVETFYIHVDRVPARFLDSDPYEGFHINRTRFNLTVFAELDIGGVTIDGVSASRLPNPVPCGCETSDFRVEVTLPEGLHRFNITLTDYAGNVASFPLNITVDVTPPNPSISGIADGSYYNRSTLPVRIELDEPGGALVDGQIPVFQGTTVLWNISLDLSVSSHEIMVWDLAGNEVAYRFVVTLDLDAPTLRFASGSAASRFYLSTTAVSFDLLTSADAVYVSDGRDRWYPNDAGLVRFAATLEEGEHEFRMFALDRANNWGFLNFTIVVDLTPPSVEQTSPANGSHVRDTSLNLQVTLTEPGEVGYSGVVFPLVEGAATVPVVVNDGDNEYVLTLRDLAGNSAEARVHLIGDRTAPFLEVSLPANHSFHPAGVFRVAGRTEPGAHVTVNGHPAEVGPDGSFATELALDPRQGLLIVSATDEAGNRATVLLALDGAAPIDLPFAAAGVAAAVLVVAAALVAFVRLRPRKARPSDPSKGPQRRG